MAVTRDNYQVQANDLQELILGLNLLFQRLADRMDKIEGIRGDPVIAATLNLDGNRISNVGESSETSDVVVQAELTDQTVSSLTVIGALVLTGTVTASGAVNISGATTTTGTLTVKDELTYVDSNGTVLHSFGA